MRRLAPGPLSVVDQNLELLAQGLALCRRLDAADYAPRAGEPAGTAIGPQLRHCIEAYRSFLAGLPVGRVDYDRRAREALLEHDPRAAADALDAIASALVELPPAVVAQPLLVRVDVAADEDPESAWTRSSGGRELRGLLSHTVHHYALIALTLRQLGHEPPAEFGVAPSTLAYERARSA